jgi:hypothetical protein
MDSSGTDRTNEAVQRHSARNVRWSGVVMLVMAVGVGAIVGFIAADHAPGMWRMFERDVPVDKILGALSGGAALTFARDAVLSFLNVRNLTGENVRKDWRSILAEALKILASAFGVVFGVLTLTGATKDSTDGRIQLAIISESALADDDRGGNALAIFPLTYPDNARHAKGDASQWGAGVATKDGTCTACSASETTDFSKELETLVRALAPCGEVDTNDSKRPVAITVRGFASSREFLDSQGHPIAADESALMNVQVADARAANVGAALAAAARKRGVTEKFQISLWQWSDQKDPQGQMTSERPYIDKVRSGSISQEQLNRRVEIVLDGAGQCDKR